jgi:RNA polymerase sigma factor (sigma-70 family)
MSQSSAVGPPASPPRSASDSCERLCDDVRRRNPSALAHLVNRYQSLAQNTIRRYLGKKLRGRVESQDMVNDFWLSVLRGIDHLPTIHESRNLRAYFRRIAFRQVTKQQRRHLTAGCRDVDRELPGINLERCAGAQPQALDAAIEREMLARMQAKTSSEEWRILQQKMQGLSNREIARREGLDEKSVRRTLRRVAGLVIED